MEKKITLYIVANLANVQAIAEGDSKEVDGIHVVKTGVAVEGVPFTSKRQALDAVELVGKFGVETAVCSQKRVVKLA